MKVASKSLKSFANLMSVALVASLLVLSPTSPSMQADASVQPLKFIAVSAGDYHTVAIDSDGNLYSWGKNDVGQLGDGTTASRSVPGLVSSANLGGRTFSSIASGPSFNVAIASDGTLYSWGENNRGQLGTGDTLSRLEPVAVSTGITFSQISLGQGFSVGLTSEGVAYSWGYNIWGQLGDGTFVQKVTPTPVDTSNQPGLTFSSIAAGGGFTVAIGHDGNVYAWGLNSSGAVGDGTNINRAVPTATQTQSPQLTFSHVSAGSGQAFAIASTGQLFGWGANDQGQLGDGSKLNRNTPVAIDAGRNYVSVAAGHRFTNAISADGYIFGWGFNFPSIGDGTTNPALSPVAASTQSTLATTFSLITNGNGIHSYHTLALDFEGRLYGWGINEFGQLGDGTTTNALLPTRFPDYFAGPVASIDSATAAPTSVAVSLSCGGSCGPGDNYNYVVSITPAGGSPSTVSGTANSAITTLNFTGLSPNVTHNIQASVTHNAQTSSTVSTSVTTPKPIATISATTVADTSATLTVGCTNCGAPPTSFTVSATPVSGGAAITSNTNVISGLQSETTYSFSVVVAFAGTTSDAVLWQGNPVMTLPFLPIISGVYPAALPLTGGTVTVTGANFGTSTELTLDGATLSFTIVSGTEMTFTAPSKTAGVFDLSITNQVGPFTLPSAITYVPGPSLISNSPVLATTNGGTIVTLTGTDLATTTQVNLGNTTVSFSVISATTVRFVTAATSAGVVDVGVVTVGGVDTLSNAIEFTTSALVPVVSSITPATGPVAGGTTVTVIGQFFSGSYSDSVSAAINGVSGSSLVLIDDSTLTFVTPAGTAGIFDVTVVTGGGLGAIPAAFTYTAAPPPAITGGGAGPTVVLSTPEITKFSTRELPTSGGEVRVEGRRLSGITDLTLGGIAVTIVSNTDTLMVFMVGAVPEGIWDLRLVADNGTLTFQQAITIVGEEDVMESTAGTLLGYTMTLRFAGNSRDLSDDQQTHAIAGLERFESADTIVCWGYTTAANPNAWAISHSTQRATAVCDLISEIRPDIKLFVRVRYGVPKFAAMRATMQFWELTETQ
jgi:alpha-tubulin suppressor-like RCC1 family protein